MGTKVRGRQGGFSLVEVMVVVMIIGLVLAAAVPQFADSNRRRRVESSANELAARIQTTRHRTVATRIPHRLVLELESKVYRTERLESDSTWVRFPDEDYAVAHGVEWTAMAGEDPANNDVEFESRGTVLEEDAPLAVTFMSAGADTFTVSLVRTGRVTVRPGAP